MNYSAIALTLHANGWLVTKRISYSIQQYSYRLWFATQKLHVDP